MTKIKICGLSRECDIEFANELKPDYIGFVFTKSKRQVSIQKATILKSKLNSNIKVVGVFVNAEVEVVTKLANDKVIDIIQLHGHEDESYITKLRMLTDEKIIKAFRIQSKDDFEKTKLSGADYLLFDNGNGGTGEVFDWSNIGDSYRDYFLAGGINTENLSDALKYNPYGIDLSSGVESNGFKDFYKMKSVIDIIRNGGKYGE